VARVRHPNDKKIPDHWRPVLAPGGGTDGYVRATISSPISSLALTLLGLAAAPGPPRHLELEPGLLASMVRALSSIRGRPFLTARRPKPGTLSTGQRAVISYSFALLNSRNLRSFGVSGRLRFCHFPSLFRK
jgi:hypothetical protein